MDKAESPEDMNIFTAETAAAETAAAESAASNTLEVVDKTDTHIKCTYNGATQIPVSFHYTGVEWMLEFDEQIIPTEVFIELTHVKIHGEKGIYAQFKRLDDEYMPYIVQIKSFDTLGPFMMAYGAINTYILDNLLDGCSCCSSESEEESVPDLEPSDDEEGEAEDEAGIDADTEDPFEEAEAVTGFPGDTCPEARITCYVARELTKTNLEHLMIGALIGALFPIIIHFYCGVLFR